MPTNLQNQHCSWKEKSEKIVANSAVSVSSIQHCVLGR